jgi:hypothetical protein
MAQPPLTITNPETLAQRLDKINTETTDKAKADNQATSHKIRINGYMVTFTVTPPSHSTGRFYGLFRVGTADDNMKKLAKKKLISKLLEEKAS